MNFDPNYLLFEETEKLIRSGQVDRVYVPVSYDRKRAGPNAVDDGFVRVMAQIARVREYELILIDEVEPIRYNVAVQIREYLKNKDVHSILVVSPGFSSRRDFLVYESVFHAVGMPIACLPVFGTKNVENWHESWHGIQEVFLELGKLWYYRLWVL